MISLSNKIIPFIVIMFLYFSSPFLIITSAADDQLEENIDAVFNIEFLSGTELIININANVKKITLEASGTSYSKNEIIIIQENESEIMGAIKYDLKNSLTNQIKTIFDKADIHSLNELPSFNNGIFYDKYSINLSSNSFNFDNKVTVSDFINGILDMGAIVNYTFNLIAKSGWNNSFNFILPDPIGYHRTTGIVNDNIIQWHVENNDEDIYSKIAELALKFNNPTSNFKEENIQFEFEINCNNNIKPILNLSIITNSININQLTLIPKFITNLNYIPSDGIRLFIDNYFATWDDFYNTTIKYLIEYIKPKIESPPFNQTLNFSFKWDISSTINCSNPFDIENMDNHPPIKALFSDNNINLLIRGISSNAFFGLINSGAKSNLTNLDINFGNNFDNIGYPYKIYLNLPDNLNQNNKNIISWNESNNIFGNITSNISEKYTEEKIDTTIEILVKTTDLNILSLFTGETKLTLSLFIKEIQNRNVSILPDYFKLPDKINLEYYNSDVFRLCIDEKIFDNASIKSFLSSENKLFEIKIKNIFPESELKGIMNSQIFDESLIWDEDIAKMGDDYPIKISSSSNIVHSLPFRFTLLPPSLNIIDQNLTLSGIKNHNIKYKIIFPQGLKIKLNNESIRTLLNISEDGKYFIEISFNKNQSTLNELISFKIIPSFIFIIGLFIPCIISLLITIILVILIYVIKRKRRIKKRTIFRDKKEKYDVNEEKEYYIPPPPSSK